LFRFSLYYARRYSGTYKEYMMFEAFFPKPKVFFGSFVLWSLACIILWFMFGQPLGEKLTLGELFGFVHLDYGALEALQEEARSFGKHSSAEHVELVMEKIAAIKSATTFWFYQFLVPCYGIFLGFWHFFAKKEWRRWSLYGSALIVFVTWFQVQLDVMINNWFGGFYDMVQKMFAEPGSITPDEYYGRIFTFFSIAGIYVLVAILNRFFIQHFNFRWRTALNERYTKLWERVRHIEGSSQRIQDDTMRFADIMEGLGVGLIDSAMTLLAFLPLLWVLSTHVSELPIIGPIAHGLVIAAVIWSGLGTAILMLTGYYLPKLNFLNKRVEAAYREELVLGEKNLDRASPMTLQRLFAHVRKNYFRLYFHYMYFNVARFTYLQAGALVPYVTLAPTLLSKEAIVAGFTLGVMQQTVRAFGRVESSFQYLVLNYPTIIEMLSIYMRLRTFEAAIYNKPLPKIDQAYLDGTERNN